MTQQAMPEAKWMWRRLYTWTVTIGSLVALGFIIQRADADGAVELGKRLIWLLGATSTLYLVGPTAEHIIAALRAWKGDPR